MVAASLLLRLHQNSATDRIETTQPTSVALSTTHEKSWGCKCLLGEDLLTLVHRSGQQSCTQDFWNNPNTKVLTCTPYHAKMTHILKPLYCEHMTILQCKKLVSIVLWHTHTHIRMLKHPMQPQSVCQHEFITLTSPSSLYIPLNRNSESTDLLIKVEPIQQLILHD